VLDSATVPFFELFLAIEKLGLLRKLIKDRKRKAHIYTKVLNPKRSN
jgi:hypothetical protein